MKRSAHQNYLDGWRGCAIVFLLIGHFFPINGINLGRIGVDLFFVLSGLLMGRLLFIQKSSLKIFYRRRISRIFPALLTYLLLVLIYFFISKQDPNWLETSAAALFVYNYFVTQIGTPDMPFGHIWSLSVEEHTYILLSIIALIGRNNFLKVKISLVSLIVVAVLTSIFYRQMNFPHQENLLMQTEIACFGIVFSAYLQINYQKLPLQGLNPFLFTLLFFAGLACHWWSIPQIISTFLGTAIFAYLVNILGNSSHYVQSFFSLYPLRTFGTWSYSIYLWQQIFYLAHHRNGLNAGFALALSLTAGIASYFLVEKPARQYLNLHWGNDRVI